MPHILVKQISVSASASRSSDSPVPPSSTCFPSSSLSLSTSHTATTVNAINRLLTASRSPQTPSSSTSSSSTSVDHVDSSSISSSMKISTASATSPLTAEPTSTGVSTSTPTPVSSIANGTTTGAESVSASFAYILSRPPNPPQQIASAPIPTDTQTPWPGSNLLTITSWSLVPIPTNRSNGSPNSSSIPNSLLPSILGPVLGVLVILALGMIIFRCRARRRSKNMSSVPSSGSEASREQKAWMMTEETPRVNAVTLGRRMASYRGSSTYAPEHIITHLSPTGKSSQNSDGQSSDPFVNGSEIVPSRTGLRPASMHSVDSVSTNPALTVPVNAVVRGTGEFGSSTEASTSSLGLHFVAPLTTDDSPTCSPHLSPSWHYGGQPPTSLPRKREHWNEEQGKTSPVSLQAPASPKSYPLGVGSARLRLRALLEEARKV